MLAGQRPKFILVITGPQSELLTPLGGGDCAKESKRPQNILANTKSSNLLPNSARLTRTQKIFFFNCSYKPGKQGRLLVNIKA